MGRKCACACAAAVILVFSVLPLCSFAETAKEIEVVEIAKKALTEKGVVYVDAVIAYDKNNQRWREWGRIVEVTPHDPNHGNLPYGMLENKKYHTVYFDYDEDARRDIWVFVDADTGKVLEIYEIK
jgi:hypothetical protein